MPQGQAFAKALPVWKMYGGLLPMDAMQPIWDGAPDVKPNYEVIGKYTIVSPGGKKMDADFSAQYQSGG